MVAQETTETSALMPCVQPRCVAVMSEAPVKTPDLAAGISTLPRDVVDGGEVVIQAIKPSMWRPIAESSVWIAASCLVALIVEIGRFAPAGFSSALTAQLALVVGVARLAFAIVSWIPTWYVLTNRRMMTVGGIKSPQVSSILLRDVCRTELTAGSLERLAGLGTITCHSENEFAHYQSWTYVVKPEDLRDRIERAIRSQW